MLGAALLVVLVRLVLLVAALVLLLLLLVLVLVPVLLALVLLVQVVQLALPPAQVVQRVWLTYRLAHTHPGGLQHLPHRTTRQGSRHRGCAHRGQPSAHLGC